MKNILLETKAGDMTQEFKVLKTLIPEFSTTDEAGNEHIESVATEIESKNWEKAWSLAQSVPTVDKLCRIEIHSKDDGKLVGYVLLKDKDGKPLKQISIQIYRDIFAELVDANKVKQFFHRLKSGADANARAERATQTPFDKEEGQHSTGIGGDLRTLGARIKGAIKGIKDEDNKITNLKTIPLNPEMFEVVDRWQDATVFEQAVAESLYKEIKNRFKESEFKNGNELVIKEFESKSSVKSCREWVVVEYLQDLSKKGPAIHDGNKGGAEGHWGIDFANRADSKLLNFLVEQVEEFGFGPELQILFTLLVKFINKEIYLTEIEWKRACNLFSDNGPYVLSDILLPADSPKTNIIYVKDLYKSNDYMDIADFYVDNIMNNGGKNSIVKWVAKIRETYKEEDTGALTLKLVRSFVHAGSNIQELLNFYYEKEPSIKSPAELTGTKVLTPETNLRSWNELNKLVSQATIFGKAVYSKTQADYYDADRTSFFRKDKEETEDQYNLKKALNQDPDLENKMKFVKDDLLHILQNRGIDKNVAKTVLSTATKDAVKELNNGK